MKFIRATVASVLLISILADIGFSRTELDIKPKISAAGRYDSNFYLSESNEAAVYSYLVQPGIQVGLKAPKTQLSLGYDFEAYFYDGGGSDITGTDSASDLNYFGHLVSFSTRYFPTSKLTAGLDDAYYQTRYPLSYDRLSDNTNDVLYSINRMTPSLLYDFSRRLALGTRYRRTDIEYDGSEIEDSTEHRGFFDLIYSPTRKTTFGLEYQHWQVNYDGESPDYTSDQVGINFQKRFKYYTIDANTGYHLRSFDGSQQDDTSTVSYKVSFTAQNPPPPDARRPPGQYVVRSKSHFYLAAERNFNNYGSNFAADRFTFSVGHVFFKKLLARIKGYYQISDYGAFGDMNTSRKDKTFNVSGSLTYLIKKNLSLSLTAGREERDSSAPSFSYKNNFFIMTFDFNFDLTGRGGHTEESLYY